MSEANDSNEGLEGVMIFVFLICLVVTGALFAWFVLKYDERETMKPEQLLTAREIWREKRNAAVEAEIANCLQELGWPIAATRMTKEEVAHLICTRLSDRIWNQRDVG